MFKSKIILAAASVIAIVAVIAFGFPDKRTTVVSVPPAPPMAKQRAEMWVPNKDGILVQEWATDTVQPLNVCLVMTRFSIAGSHGALTITCTPID